MSLAEHFKASSLALGASNVCLAGEKPDVLRPGIVTMRGSVILIKTTAVHDTSTPPPVPNHLVNENPTYSIPALQGREGLYHYGHTTWVMHEVSTPLLA